MAKIIGYVTKIEGRYLARDDAGNNRELSVGDPIYDNDTVFGANGNNPPLIEVNLPDGTLVQNSGTDPISPDGFKAKNPDESIDKEIKEDEQRVQELAPENKPFENKSSSTSSSDSDDSRLEAVGQIGDLLPRDAKEIRASSNLRDTEFNRFTPDPDGAIQPRSTTSGAGNPLPLAIDDFDTVIHETDSIANGNILNNDTSTGGLDLDVKIISSANTGNAATQTSGFFLVQGEYGNLEVNIETGAFTYSLNNSDQDVIDLHEGETLQDIFPYTNEESDGDTASATLTITIYGVSEGPPSLVVNDSLVYESGLDDDGSDAAADTEIAENIISFETPDRLVSIEIGGEVFDQARLDSLNTTAVSITSSMGTLELYAYDSVTNDISYRYTLLDDVSHPLTEQVFDRFDVKVTDDAGVSRSDVLDVEIVDDVPTASPDTNSLQEGLAITHVLGNVIPNDVLGADETLSPVTGVVSGTDTSVAVSGNVGASLVVTYGTLTLESDGSYRYDLDGFNPNVMALQDGESLLEEIVYTITDGDGDTSTTTLVIDIQGKTGGMVLLVDEHDVFEAGLSYVDAPDVIGSEESSNSSSDSSSEFTAGEIKFIAEDGVKSVTIGGTVVLFADLDGINTTPITITTPKGEMILNGHLMEIVTATGGSHDGESFQKHTLSYSYELTDVQDHSGDIEVHDLISVTLTDLADKTQSKDVDVNIIDDVPTALNDDESAPRQVEEGGLAITGNILVGADPDGADTQGADGASVTGFTYDGGTLGVLGVQATTSTGLLTVNADGTWSFTPNTSVDNSNGPVEANFDYTITDGDGDTSVATQFIEITDTPPVVTPSNVVVEEDGFFNDDAGLDWDADGSLGISSNDAISDVTFNAGQTTSMTSFGKTITYTLDASKHLLTATDSDGNTVFTVQLNNTSDKDTAGYTFTLVQGVDHLDADGKNSLFESFGVTVSDIDGSTATASFTAEIVDSLPFPGALITSMDEDGTLQLVRIADGFENGEITIDGDVVTSGSSHDVTDAQSADVVGSVINNGDGTVSFTPLANYSGLAEFTYTVKDFDGDPATGTISVTVNPVADAPTVMGENANHLEDSNNSDPILLNFNLGLDATLTGVTDNVDIAPGSTNDTPERLGILTLEITSGEGRIMNGGSEVAVVSGTTTVKFFISDVGFSPTDIDQTGSISITKAEYEALSFEVVEDNATNVQYTVSKASHEVDSSGALLSPDVVSVTVKDIGLHDVLAVTDPVNIVETVPTADGDLIDDDDGLLGIQTINENEVFDLGALINEEYGDEDGSEKHFYRFDGLPDGTEVVVDGVSQISDGSTTLEFEFNTTYPTTLTEPSIGITPPSGFAGEIFGTVTLVALDTDADSAGTITEQTDQITFRLQVLPTSGDIEIKNVTTNEDTSVNVFKNVNLTDTDGSENITQIKIAGIALDWKLFDHLGNEIVLVDDGGGLVSAEYILTADELANYKDITVLPPAHSSTDGSNITVSVTSQDSAFINGILVLAPEVEVVKSDFKVTVKPIAEIQDDNTIPSGSGIDTDGNTVDDIDTQGDHVYGTLIDEDDGNWISLNIDPNDGAFAGLLATNEDDINSGNTYASEETFIKFSNVPLGTLFSIDNGVTTLRVTDVNDGIEIPLSELANIKFQPAENYSGTLEIHMIVHTIDTDEDNSNTHENFSPEDVLTFVIAPVADPATVLVQQASGLEDAGRLVDGTVGSLVAGQAQGFLPDGTTANNAIALDIHVSSLDTDGSETFNVHITGIPAGAEIYYDGALVSLRDASGDTLIENFDNDATLYYVPELNSNDDLSLGVYADTIDGSGDVDSNIGDPANAITLDIDIKGVADNVQGNELNIVEVLDVDGVAHEYNAVFAENALDDGSQTLSLIDIFVNAGLIQSFDNLDGSEELSMLVKSDFFLEDGVIVNGATIKSDTTYSFTLAELANVSITTPTHFSGEIPLNVTYITTENDGDVNASSQDVKVWVTPEADAIVDGTVTEHEDLGENLVFNLNQNGDTNEEMNAIYIKVSDIPSDVTLYIGAGNEGTPLSGAVDGYFKIEGADMSDIYAINNIEHNHLNNGYDLTVKFDITDHTNNAPDIYTVTTTSDQNYHVDVVATPDKPTMGMVGGPNFEVDDINSGVGNFSIDFTLQSADLDGSETHTRYRIEGLPDGITVDNGTPAGVGTGVWIIDANADAPVNGVSTQTVNFTYGFDVFDGGADHVITIVGYNVDTLADGAPISPLFSTFGALGAPSGAIDENNSDDFEFTLDGQDIGGGGGTPPDPIVSEGVSASIIETTQVEDIPFNLSSILSVSQVNPAEFLSVVISGLPEGTVVSNAYQDAIDIDIDGDGIPEIAVPVWIVSDYDNAIITLPENINNNNKDDSSFDGSGSGFDDLTPDLLGNIQFDVSSTPAGGIPGPLGETGGLDLPSLDVTPVTDSISLQLSADYYDIVGTIDTDPAVDDVIVAEGIEGGYTNIEFDGSVSVDNPYGNLVEPAGGVITNFYVTTDTGVSGKLVNRDTNVEYTKTGDTWEVPKGQVLDVNNDFNSKLRFIPDEFSVGEVTLTITANNQEDGASNIESVLDTITLEYTPVVDGVDFVINPSIGLEDTYIELDIAYTQLDSSEELIALVINNASSDFLIFYGPDVNNLQQATNGGASTGVLNLTDNDWVVPIGQKVWVLPPENRDDDLIVSEKELKVSIYAQATDINGDLIGKPEASQSAPVRVQVLSDADGININPTTSFGIEGQDVQLNLNAAMLDLDGSETMTLTVQGLGANATFKIDGNVRLNVYDSGTDTYTLAGIAAEDINSIVFIQKATAQTNITVEAYTVEGAGDGNPISSTVIGNFSLTILSAQATSGDDLLLFNPNGSVDGLAGEDTMVILQGQNIDFENLGSASIANIEIIDITQNGTHALNNITGQSVVDMTDSNNALSITSDTGDSVSLSNNANDVWVQQGISGIYESTTGTTLTLSGDATVNDTALDTTAGDDILGYNGTDTVDGVGGNDTLVLLPSINIDFNTLGGSISNIETIDLQSDSHTLDNLKLADVIALTDGNNHLTILGDATNSVNLVGTDVDNGGGGDGSEDWIVTDNLDGFQTYTNTNDPSVEIKIENSVNDQII